MLRSGAAVGGAIRLPTVTGHDQAGCPSRGWPHSPQNLKRGGFSAPQPGQRRRSAAPHSPQNFIPSGFANPQLGHCMSTPFPAWSLLLYHESATKQRQRSSKGRVSVAQQRAKGDGVPPMKPSVMGAVLDMLVLLR
jgi:hypothetical protein